MNAFPRIQISLKSGMPVNLASSVGSLILLSRMSSLSRGYNRSTPAIDMRRLERRLRAVIAGNGLRVKE